MTAWGSFALEVPNLNLRSFPLVSSEKAYSRDSEDCRGQHTFESLTLSEADHDDVGFLGIVCEVDTEVL